MELNILSLLLKAIRGFHILGALFGTGAATLEEILYFRDIRDGKIDEWEARQLRITYKIMRWSIITLIISGVAMVAILRFKYSPAVLYDPRLVAKYIIVGIMVINAVLIQFRKIPMWIASPLSLTSWWAESILGRWRGLEASLYVIMIGYFIAVVVVGLILYNIKKLAMRPKNLL